MLGEEGELGWDKLPPSHWIEPRLSMYIPVTMYYVVAYY